MCTVSFISNKGTYFITSNRDEHVSRPASYRPKGDTVAGTRMIYPKDPQGGGTWFAINEFGSTGVLLNGAFKRHKRKDTYAKSRGLVLLDIMAEEDSLLRLGSIKLDEIEPFTLVLFQQASLMEIRWDGKIKHFREKDPRGNHIWSSTTLYEPEVIRKRENLFGDFLKHLPNPDSEEIIAFHSTANEDSENGLIINRTNGLRTFSVTQAFLSSEGAILDHMDLLNDKKYSVSLEQDQSSYQLQ